MLAALLEDPPPRLVEFVDILDSRQAVARAAAGGFLGLGVIVALITPSVLPRHPVVGAAVGVGALLVAVAAVLATDANDLIIRGPQHVRAAGSRAATIVPAAASPQTTGRLARLVAGRAELGARVVSIVPASKSVRDIPTWTDLIAAELAGASRRLVVVDLTGSWGDVDDPGVTAVSRGRTKLSEAVTFDPELTIARLGTGADPQAARESVVGFLARIPKDVDMVLLAMPSLTMAGALTAVGATDAALVLAEVDVTHRLAMIGTLDAIDDVGVEADVILLDRGRVADVDAFAPDDEVEAVPVDEGLADVGVGLDIDDELVPPRSPADIGTQPFPAIELVEPNGRTAVRTAAALGTFAEEVWRRGDAE